MQNLQISVRTSNFFIKKFIAKYLIKLIILTLLTIVIILIMLIILIKPTILILLIILIMLVILIILLMQIKLIMLTILIILIILNILILLIILTMLIILIILLASSGNFRQLSAPFGDFVHLPATYRGVRYFRQIPHPSATIANSSDPNICTQIPLISLHLDHLQLNLFHTDDGSSRR